MKNLLAVGLLMVGWNTFAADVGQITMAAPPARSGTVEKSNITEVGIQYSSINDGSGHATVGLLHEFDNGFAMGVRGYLPLEFHNQSQAYMGEVVGRFILLNEVNQMFIDATLAEGFFNDALNGRNFVIAGGQYGYLRKFTPELALGGKLGLNYSTDRITQDNIESGNATLYTSMSVIGAFYF